MTLPKYLTSHNKAIVCCRICIPLIRVAYDCGVHLLLCLEYIYRYNSLPNDSSFSPEDVKQARNRYWDMLCHTRQHNMVPHYIEPPPTLFRGPSIPVSKVKPVFLGKGIPTSGVDYRQLLADDEEAIDRPEDQRDLVGKYILVKWNDNLWYRALVTERKESVDRKRATHAIRWYNTPQITWFKPYHKSEKLLWKLVVKKERPIEVDKDDEFFDAIVLEDAMEIDEPSNLKIDDSAGQSTTMDDKRIDDISTQHLTKVR